LSSVRTAAVETATRTHERSGAACRACGGARRHRVSARGEGLQICKAAL